MDPISGAKVSIQEIVSYGSYIYQWPSKYDAVFWPFTAEEFIWFSPKSGYIAFAPDFNKISDAEKEHVSKFLRENYDPKKQPESFDAKLDWLEKVYAARGAPPRFWLRFHCLRSYLSRKDPKASSVHRSQAIRVADEMVGNLKEDGEEKAAALYILAAYSRMQGFAEKADEYVKTLAHLKWKSAGEEPASQEVIEHFLKLHDEIKTGQYREEYFSRP